MKQCPRCKSVLAKSHGEKMICKVCGFVTRNLEVARDNQEFQDKHHFGKKIGLVKASERNIEDPYLSEKKNHYLVSFQNALRSAAKILNKEEESGRKLEQKIREIWFSYLHIAKERNMQIMGIFSKHIKTKASEPNSHDGMENENANNEFEGKKEEEEDGKEFKEEEEENKEDIDINEPVKRKRGRKRKEIVENYSTKEEKKLCFKLQIRHKLKEIEEEYGLSSDDALAHFLDFIYNYCELSMSEEMLELISRKYCLLLIENMRKYNLFPLLHKKQTNKLSLTELQILIKMRGHNFTEKAQMQTVLLLEDLLCKWYSNFSMNDTEEHISLDKLVVLYNQYKEQLGNNTITQFIDYLLKLIENEKKDLDNKQTQVEFPTLSYNLFYSILYMGLNLVSITLTVDEMLSKIVGIRFIFIEKQIPMEEKVSCNIIRKNSMELSKITGIKCEVDFQSVLKWMRKYIYICGLDSHERRILYFTKTLFSMHKNIEKEEFLDKNSDSLVKNTEFLEQDIMSKSLLTIYIKLEIGFSNVPYLSVMPLECLEIFSKGEAQGAKEIVEVWRGLENKGVVERRGVSLVRVFYNLMGYYNGSSERVINAKIVKNENSYSALEGLGVEALLKKIRMNNPNKNTFQFKLSLPSRPPLTLPKPLPAPPVVTPPLAPSRKLSQEASLVSLELASESMPSLELDHPSSNYEFLYDYNFNVKVIGRELFVAFCEGFVNRECRMSAFYTWLQKFEKVLIRFEN